MSDSRRRFLAPVVHVAPALALVVLFNAVFTPGFFDISIRDGRLVGTMIDVLSHGSRIGLVAVGMALVIATGGVDLSVGAVAAVAGAIAAALSSALPWPLAIGVALAGAALLGAWNAGLVNILRLQPIVATLILMVAGRGVAQWITGGVVLDVRTPAMEYLANGHLLGLPAPAWVLGGSALAVLLVTRGTSLGLFLEASGDAPEAARLAGVPTGRARLVAYGVCAALAGASGLVEASYIRAADPNSAGALLELDAILAVVISGGVLTGGRFSICGAIAGAMLMQMITKTLYMQDVSADVAPAPKAGAVAAICLVQSRAFRGHVLAWASRITRRPTA